MYTTAIQWPFYEISVACDTFSLYSRSAFFFFLVKSRLRPLTISRNNNYYENELDDFRRKPSNKLQAKANNRNVTLKYNDINTEIHLKIRLYLFCVRNIEKC